MSTDDKDKTMAARMDEVDKLVTFSIGELVDAIGEDDMQLLVIELIGQAVILLCENKCTKHASLIWLSAYQQLIMNADGPECESLERSVPEVDPDAIPDISKQH